MDTSHNDQLGQPSHYKIGIKTLYTVISECDKGLITGPLRYVFDRVLGRSIVAKHDHGAARTTSPMTGSIDHKNRNKLETRETCVGSKSFNSWNCVRTDRPSTRRFRVSPRRQNGTTVACSRINNTCMLDTSTQSVHRSCDSLLRLWKLAETSDLLVTEDQFSPDAAVVEEMRAIVNTIALRILLRARRAQEKRSRNSRMVGSKRNIENGLRALGTLNLCGISQELMCNCRSRRGPCQLSPRR
jgi:hypothetical protein